ncbi:VCBS protein [Candidatus Vecturithrix granuli]|uniref:VCBS protein n=1 Tax=Vecturithrix granuli TaxID=1499967 RepID=A0A081C2R7_VECG1|nr:VCBS protein [Candidatus Vecturithrix granuli]
MKVQNFSSKLFSVSITLLILGILVSLVVSPALADTFTFPGGSLTTKNLNAWGGVNTIQYNAYFDFSTGPSTITVYGLDLTDIWYEGKWPWPPLAESLGAQARFGINANGFWSQHQIHSAIGNGGGSWDQQSAAWDHDDGFRKYLIQNQWSGTTSDVTVGNHQYNVEAYIPRIGAGSSVNDPSQVTDRAYNTFDMKITYTPTSTPGAYEVQGWVRLHKAASTDEMAVRPGSPVWGSPYTWVWNKAINNQTNPENAWVPFFDGAWTITGDYTSARPYLEIINWGVPQTRNHTFSWDSMVVEGTPVIPDEVWVDDDWTGHSNGDIVDGHVFGYDAFATIQDGIDAVSGSTVHVAAGTYNEAVTVNKSVSLLGSLGAILDGSGVGGNGFLIKAANISIDGFEIKNFAIGVRTYGGPSDFGNLDILNCNIHDNTQNGMLIVYDTFDTVTVGNCEISSNGQNGVGLGNNTTITALNINDTAVSDNGQHGMFVAQTHIASISIGNSQFIDSKTYSGITFGTTASTIGSFVMEGGELSGNKESGLSIVQKASTFQVITLNGVAVKNNKASGVMLGGGASTGNLSVLNSTFQGNSWEEFDLSGGWFGAFSVSGDTSFTGNTFEGGPWAAIYIGDLASFGSAPVIFNNDLSGYGNAVFNASTTIVNASGNWWGTNTPAGVASKVTAATVDYTPWLHSGTDTGDPSFQGDFSTLHVDDDSPQVGATGRIQEAIDLVTGSTIYVAAGTYEENINVNTSVEIIGAGSGDDPASNTIITQTTAGAGETKIGVVQLSASGTSGNPILLQDMRLEPVGMAGISVGRFTEGTGQTVEHVKLDNVQVIGTNANPSTEQERGLYVDLTSTLRYLDVDNCAFDNLTYGWYLQKAVSADASTVRYVTVDNTTFNHNNHKGLYAEKLSDATFTGCTADDNGFDSSALPSYFAPWSAGIDINLKAGTYTNLAFMTCTITNNANDEAKEGVGLTVKARDDGSYSAYPATLTNVTIEDGLFSGNERGIRIGEPLKNNAGPINVQVHYNNITGNVQNYSGNDGSQYGGLINHTQTQVHGTCNWWGAADGPSGAGSGSGDAVSSNVEFIPWLLDPAPDGACEGYPLEGITIEKSQELEFDRGSDPFTETPFVDHGDEIVYSIEVTNTFAQAVDVLVSDAMSAYVDYLADSLEVYINGIEFDDPDKEDSISYDAILDVYSLAYVFNSLGANETLKLEFTVKVEDFVPLGEWIENFAIVTVTIPGLEFEVESNTVRVEVVPEPATFFLIGSGLLGIGALVWRKRKQ